MQSYLRINLVFILFWAIILLKATPVCATQEKSSFHKSSITEEEATNIRVYKNANKGVVNIANISSGQDPFFNLVPREGCGSGTIISADGYILTNYHVVENASTLRVTIFDGTVIPATVVGVDPANDLPF